MAVIIGAFVDPGVVEGADDPKNRKVEYDAFDDRYVNSLLSEVIPEVVERHAVTDAPDLWGIFGGSSGGSSGGNCAFAAAWLRPDCGCCDRADPASWSCHVQRPGESLAQ